jgi:deoxyribodipyrimidine photo-lyase
MKDRSPLAVSERVTAFTDAAVEDCLRRHGDRLGPRGPVTQDPETVADWAADAGFARLIVSHPPVGPAADALAVLDRELAARGIDLIRGIRPFDQAAWPHATHGFFRFKEHIPTLVGRLKGLSAA